MMALLWIWNIAMWLTIIIAFIKTLLDKRYGWACFFGSLTACIITFLIFAL